MDSWQPDAGLSPRHAETRRKGQIEQEVRLQRANEEGRRLEPEAPDGVAGHRRAADAIHQGGCQPAKHCRGPVLEESTACSINSGSVGIEEDFPEGSPEPQQPPQGP